MSVNMQLSLDVPQRCNLHIYEMNAHCHIKIVVTCDQNLIIYQCLFYLHNIENMNVRWVAVMIIVNWVTANVSQYAALTRCATKMQLAYKMDAHCHIKIVVTCDQTLIINLCLFT